MVYLSRQQKEALAEISSRPRRRGEMSELKARRNWAPATINSLFVRGLLEIEDELIIPSSLGLRYLAEIRDES